MMIMGMDWQTPRTKLHESSSDISAIPPGTRESLKRLCGFYGGSERELLARLISDLERDTLAVLPSTERDDYFSAAR
jgi:hypothetical protein